MIQGFARTEDWRLKRSVVSCSSGLRITLGIQRQGKIEGASLANLTVNPDLATVSFDDHFTDDKAETGSFGTTVLDVAALAILFEKMTDFLCRYARAIVFYPNFGFRCIDSNRRDLDLAPFA